MARHQIPSPGVSSTTPRFEARCPPFFDTTSIMYFLMSFANSSFSSIVNFFKSFVSFTLSSIIITFFVKFLYIIQHFLAFFNLFIYYFYTAIFFRRSFSAYFILISFISPDDILAISCIFSSSFNCLIDVDVLSFTMLLLKK